jgi:hypothetical protein
VGRETVTPVGKVRTSLGCPIEDGCDSATPGYRRPAAAEDGRVRHVHGDERLGRAGPYQTTKDATPKPVNNIPKTRSTVTLQSAGSTADHCRLLPIAFHRSANRAVRYGQIAAGIPRTIHMTAKTANIGFIHASLI